MPISKLPVYSLGAIIAHGFKINENSTNPQDAGKKLIKQQIILEDSCMKIKRLQVIRLNCLGCKCFSGSNEMLSAYSKSN